MGDIPEGWMHLFDEVDPGLNAGRYRVTASLEINQAQGGAPPLTAPPQEHMYVEVEGPRFTLEARELLACHPPAGAHGDFATRLPHVVLGRRSLAWERRLTDGTPWLALLVFRKGEARLAGPLPLRAAVGEALFSRLHELEPIPGDGPPVTTVTFLDGDILRRILPSHVEMSLLCHARQVSLTDSALALGDDDGWFSVVTANRLPLAPTGSTAYVAALVSLEGREELWALPAGAPASPLVALAHWEFTSSSGGTFEYLAQELDSAPFGAPKADTPVLTDEAGTIALDGTDRRGAVGESRYRGPLVAAPPGTGPALPRGTGHVSAEAAFELGRLLGSADGRFTRELVAWHRETDARVFAHASLREATKALGPPRGAPRSVKDTEPPRSVAELTQRVRQLAVDAQRPAAARRARKATPVLALERAAPPTPPPTSEARLARLAAARREAAHESTDDSGENHG